MKVMKSRIVFWGFFSLDYKAMETYLEQMSAEGWQLERVGKYTAKFRATEPQDLKYYVDVFKDGGPLNPERDAEDYRSLCEESGWNFVTSHDYLQFFSAPRNTDPTPLQTDETIEQKIVETTLWPRELGGIVMFFVILLMARSQLSGKYAYNNLLTSIGVVGTYVYPLLAVPMFFVGVYTLAWILRARHNIKQGLPRKTTSLKSARARAFAFHGVVLPLLLLIALALLADAFVMPRIVATALLPVGVGLTFLLFKKRLKQSTTTLRRSKAIVTVLLIISTLGTIAVGNLLITGLGSSETQARIPSSLPILMFADLAEPDDVGGHVVSNAFKRGMSPLVPTHYDYWEVSDTNKGMRMK